jgi:hypothetical protein
VLLVALTVRAAAAHGPPAELVFWGGFGPRTAGCQRSIGHVAAECALEAWKLRRACREHELNGAGCDRQTVNRAVELIRIGAGNSIGEPVCRSADVAILNFLNLAEARTDVDRSCRDTVAAVETTVFASPALPTDPSPADLRCVAAVADAATQLFASALRERTRMLDRIALRIMAPRDKNALIETSEGRVAGMSGALDARLSILCPDGSLAALYGRSATELLEEIRDAADCLVGGTYAQAAVTCPTP